jgi:hypothetical protein
MTLADENIDHSLIKAIRIAGFEVHSIYESNRGLPDEAIIDFSRNPPRIINPENSLETIFMILLRERDHHFYI